MSEKLTDAQRAAAEDAMAEAVLDPHGASFAELYSAANCAAGRPAEDADGPCYRLADRFLQKHRKTGDVEFRRIGRTPVWFATTRAALRLAKGDQSNG